MVFLGIDPGAQGGIAYLADGTLVTHELAGMTHRQLLDYLRDVAVLSQDVFGRPHVRCVLEQVGGFVAGDRGQSGMGPSMFAFGKGVGHLEMALCAAEIPYTTVVPRVWQKQMGVPKRPPGLSDSAWKGLLHQHAERMFPQDRFTRTVADAVLLAEFCRRFQK